MICKSPRSLQKIGLLLALFLALSPLAKAQQQLTVVKAVYSGGDIHHDVTSIVAGQIQNGQLKIHVNNRTFGVGVEFAFGIRKTLTVDYKTPDGEFILTANEGKDLEIPSPNAARATLAAQAAMQTKQQLTIVKADYFAGDAHSDVTSLLTGEIQDGAWIQTHVNNRYMGVAPDFGPQIVKTLTVDYKTPDGEFTLTAMEGDTLKIPNPKATRATQLAQPPPQAPLQPVAPASNQPPPSNTQQPLTIVKAVYASRDIQKDVTALLAGMIHDGQIQTDINNDKLGGDPSPGKSKILTVDYRTATGEFTVTATEGQTLVIPNPKAVPAGQPARSAP